MSDPRTIHKMMRLFTEFQKLYPSMPVSMAVTFFAISYLDEPTSVEIASHAQLTRSAASRYTQDLGSGSPTEAGRRAPPIRAGLGLVEGRTDPLDMRIVRFRPTPKGRALLALLTRIAEA
jgi:DNA-binding MarR family transcriptional regulator